MEAVINAASVESTIARYKEAIGSAEQLFDIRQMLNDAGIKNVSDYYYGHCKGTVAGAPYAVGTYNTVANGGGYEYFRSSLDVGQTFQVGEEMYVCVMNDRIPGSPYSMSRTWFVAVLVTE